MKHFPRSLKWAFFLALSLPLGAFAQKKATVEQMLHSRNFVFRAQTMHPTGGQTQQITGEYDIRVNSDSLVSVLPYFGRAYSAPSPGDEGLRFTSVDFGYDVKKKKKGRYEVSIRPRDTRDVRQIFLSVSESGYGRLQVVSNNRQTVSFSGYMMPAGN